eukprot:4045309-Pyramimonas_sp.AAC.1
MEHALARNIATRLTYWTIGAIQPRQWICGLCRHGGWRRVPVPCEACGCVDEVHPVNLEDRCAVHHQNGKARAWDGA